MQLVVQLEIANLFTAIHLFVAMHDWHLSQGAV
jgi:hypothetical protein